MDLQTFFTQNPRVALAFSGGTDSAYLLYAAQLYGCDVKAYFVKTAFQPQFEQRDALRLAKELDVKLEILTVDVFNQPKVVENRDLRCYHCKTALFTTLRSKAMADGYPVLIDGTNASDDCDDRPGMKALAELGVRSPLRECGITKADVRRLSREAGLFTHNKPSYACLATRIPTGTPITLRALEKVERAEDFLSGLGYTDFRVRILGDAARIQLPESQFVQAIGQKTLLQEKLSADFSAVLLDLKPRA